MKSKKSRTEKAREFSKARRDGRPSHIITLPPTHIARGRDLLIPVLLDWPYSCVFVDPKGERACVTNPCQASGVTDEDADELRKRGLI
jgi:type IV secretory pathway TraG/TraD family ATPase VirD4